jgi:hypothetical protein
MKLNHIIPQPLTGQVIQQFGEAKLIRQRNGEHALIGGSSADRMAAFEWVSLFAHEIVFTHFYRQAVRGGRQGVWGANPICRTA